jgi:hypothetical protein
MLLHQRVGLGQRLETVFRVAQMVTDVRQHGAACGGVVLGDQLRLGPHECGEPGFEDLGNLLVDLLPGVLEQRRIGRVLD